MAILHPPTKTVGHVQGSRMIRVIEIEARAGEGTEADPARRVLQWWTLEGKLLAERDPWREEEDAHA